MKDTGVTRRIDELGRIVIPKEIRRNLKLKEGDKVEIFVDERLVVLKKQSSLNGLDEDIYHLLEALRMSINFDVLLTDSDKVIYSLNERKYEGKEITGRIKKLLNERKVYDGHVFDIVNMSAYNKDIYLKPLLSNGDLLGSLIVLQNKGYLSESNKEMIDLISSYIIKKLEFY